MPGQDSLPLDKATLPGRIQVYYVLGLAAPDKHAESVHACSLPDTVEAMSKYRPGCDRARSLCLAGENPAPVRLAAAG